MGTVAGHVDRTPAALRSMFSDVLRHRHLLLSLTGRDLKVRYKQSLLGIGWAVVLPIAMMLVFTFVFTRAIDAPSFLHARMPYALFAYAGLAPWMFFSSSLSGCINSLVANRNLVTKVYFPREVFPLSCVAASFVDFCIAMLALFGLMLYWHCTGDWPLRPSSAWVFLPLIVLVQVMLTAGLGLLLAMGHLFYRDVRQVFNVAIQLWMFVSAVVVPLPQDGTAISRLLSFNPLVPMMNAYRDCLLHGRLPDLWGLAYAAIVAVLVLSGGWSWFRRTSHRFAECI